MFVAAVRENGALAHPITREGCFVQDYEYGMVELVAVFDRIKIHSRTLRTCYAVSLHQVQVAGD